MDKMFLKMAIKKNKNKKNKHICIYAYAKKRFLYTDRGLSGGGLRWVVSKSAYLHLAL